MKWLLGCAAMSLLLLASGCATSAESIGELPKPQQWAEAEAAQQVGDLARAQTIYEIIFAEQRIPAAAWRSAELVAALRKQQPGYTFAASDDSFRLVTRVLALALEGDAATARKGLELLHERLAGDRDRAAHTMLFLGDLDLQEGKLDDAAAKYWAATAAILKDDFRDGGHHPTDAFVWGSLRGMECAALQNDWLVARRRLGLFESRSLSSTAQAHTNQELRDRVRDEFGKWLERVTDPQEKRQGVRKQLAARSFTDGVIMKVGGSLANLASEAKLTEVQLLMENGDVFTAVVPAGTALDPATFVGHGRIDRCDGGIAWGMLDKGRLREGIAMAARGCFDVIDDFQVQNGSTNGGDKLRHGDSILRTTLRLFATEYDDGRVAVDYFDRRTARHMQLQWQDLSMLSVVNQPMQALIDADDRREQVASSERLRRAEAESRERASSRAFEFNVDPKDHICLKCHGVGQIYRGGYVQQNVWGWQAGLNASDGRMVNGTLYQSGGMETCNWCSGTGQR